MVRYQCLFAVLVAAQPQPIGVEHAGLVDALIGVGAEVIALGLQQVGRQPLLAIAVVVGQRGGERRHGNAQCIAVPTTCRQAGCAFSTALVKYGASSRFSSFGSASKASLMRSRNARPDDAAAAPQQGDVAVVERPVVFLGRRLHLHEALGVAANLRGVQGLRASASMNVLRSPVNLAVGPLSTLLARTRASFMADRQRA